MVPSYVPPVVVRGKAVWGTKSASCNLGNNFLDTAETPKQIRVRPPEVPVEVGWMMPAMNAIGLSYYRWLS